MINILLLTGGGLLSSGGGGGGVSGGGGGGWDAWLGRNPGFFANPNLTAGLAGSDGDDDGGGGGTSEGGGLEKEEWEDSAGFLADKPNWIAERGGSWLDAGVGGGGGGGSLGGGGGGGCVSEGGGGGGGALAGNAFLNKKRNMNTINL